MTDICWIDAKKSHSNLVSWSLTSIFSTNMAISRTMSHLKHVLRARKVQNFLF